MANLKEIKVRINSVKSTRQITSAMKMVSAAKLRRAQDAILQLRPYFDKLNEIIQHVGSQLEEGHVSPYEKVNEDGRILLVSITSNRGLCGAFNTNVIRKTLQSMNENYAAERNEGKIDIIGIGKKGSDLFRTKKYPLTEHHNEIFDELTFDHVSRLAQSIIGEFLSGKYREVRIIYNQFKNAAVQELVDEQFLPVMYEREAMTEDIPGSKYEIYTDYLLEPGIAEIFEEMVPYYLNLQFFRALLESFASEHGARMTAMHQATDNATELIRELELNYNKARQAAITKEILEIVSGADALSA